jgi:hypothetical protein
MLSHSEILDYSENDWGFYIDLENIKHHTLINNEEFENNKIFKNQYNDYEVYKEINDEYEYYTKNYEETDIYTINVFDKKPDFKNIFYKNGIKELLVRVSSTTIITAFLTYIIFCLL